MIEAVAIDHIVLRTANLDAMLNFYVKILGCKVERETTPETGLTQLRAGSALIDLITVEGELGKLGGGAPTLTENNMDHFCLQIAPVTEEDLVQYLQGHGVETPEFEERYGAQGRGNTLYIKDPDQNTVELTVQRAAQH